MGNDKFIELVSKHLTNEISKEESAELKYLIANSPACKKQFEDLSMYWEHTENEQTNDAIAFQKIQDKIKRLEEKGETDDTAKDFLIPTSTTQKQKSITRFLPAAAAAILLLAIGVYLLKTFVLPGKTENPSTAGWQTEITPKGSKKMITLPDGTNITLNSQSIIKYPSNFSSEIREVTLSGEAYFDVRKDHKRPFIIHTNNMDLKVLGTTFNLKCYPGDTVTETTLINGAIEVTLKDRPSDRIILKPKEKLIVKNTGSDSLKLIPAVGTSRQKPQAQYVLTSVSYLSGKDSSVNETSWINNRFSFDDNSFEELAQKMERWYGVEIRFKNNSAKHYRFSGVFDNDTLVQALNALRELEKFDYKISGSTVYIY